MLGRLAAELHKNGGRVDLAELLPLPYSQGNVSARYVTNLNEEQRPFTQEHPYFSEHIGNCANGKLLFLFRKFTNNLQLL